jgi:hypothetical protein
MKQTMGFEHWVLKKKEDMERSCSSLYIKKGVNSNRVCIDLLELINIIHQGLIIVIATIPFAMQEEAITHWKNYKPEAS